MSNTYKDRWDGRMMDKIVVGFDIKVYMKRKGTT
jgi:hypothetical protein